MTTVYRRDPEEADDPNEVSGDELGDGPHGEDAIGDDADDLDAAVAQVQAATATLTSEQGTW